MDLAVILGIGAFVILEIMLALLWVSRRQDERRDPITQEIIIKANTGPVTVNTTLPTQEKED